MPPYQSQIPYAGIYKQRQREALLAHQRAQVQVNARRNQLAQRYGLLADGSGVDPQNPYGMMQRTRYGQAMELDEAHERAAGRGLGREGLANQPIRHLRYLHDTELHDLGQDYLSQAAALQNQLMDDSFLYHADYWGALADAANAALDAGDFTTAEVDPNTGQATTAPRSTGVLWGGNTYTTKAALAKHLASKGVNYWDWAQSHKQAHSQLAGKAGVSYAASKAGGGSGKPVKVEPKKNNKGKKK